MRGQPNALVKLLDEVTCRGHAIFAFMLDVALALFTIALDLSVSISFSLAFPVPSTVAVSFALPVLAV